jgi:hypothetical protein
MNVKTLAIPIVLLAVAFIGFGDRILPSPLNTVSFNNTLMGLSPQLKPQKPDAAMEKAVNGLPQ